MNRLHGSSFVLTLALCSFVAFDLAGSNFAAVRIADDGSSPGTLPVEFPYRCDMLRN